MDIPQCTKCGKPARGCYSGICEDCFIDRSDYYHEGATGCPGVSGLGFSRTAIREFDSDAGSYQDIARRALEEM